MNRSEPQNGYYVFYLQLTNGNIFSKMYSQLGCLYLVILNIDNNNMQKNKLEIKSSRNHIVMH